MKRVCVFCGSNSGANPAYAKAAAQLGRLLAERGQVLVYGGGNVGLMGVVADAALAAGGQVIGVIPESMLKWEVGHPDLTELRVVASMHERKAAMADLADAFIALPGGIGTLEELFEIWTWGQLGLHAKPLGFLDVAGYFERLHAFLDHMAAEGFVKARHREMVAVHNDPAILLALLDSYRPPETIRVIDRETA
ncbi:TIGR00730 family Rossman fold protein [Paramagnetospirillum magneticum]|uniref:Cytokinin riboside 5'-monophosphate phosphoribohydrolase n=1 Tax=Paramagnetospirillum magneticum (strain ATCC 700264 / AMB-1) TaxID=342108 RepID=Q2W3B2_PARM1|nr:TIGR00730 family Rossman fold protein [Paramagnetospirillum magneticum]BAE51663.1 Predicted Rossmann fold nucleotide-binding protein [Paramagnetospirillum magneticum AMB-1]